MFVRLAVLARPTRKLGGVALGAAAATAVGVAALDFQPMQAEDLMHVPAYPFNHKGPLSTLDIARFAAGRGTQAEIRAPPTGLAGVAVPGAACRCTGKCAARATA